MHPNAGLLESFFQAFQRGDAEAMIACYHPEARFSDPVFPDLDRDQVAAMWRMLCGARGADLRVTHGDVQADDRRGSARWEARYRFSATGRPVHNRIRSEFEFEDGKIRRHRDAFGFYRWTRMALGGVVGLVLGWTPLVRKRVRATARARLDAFRAKAR